MATSDEEPLVQLDALQIKVLVEEDVPRRDVVIREKGLLCRLQHPLLFALQVFEGGAQGHILVTGRSFEVLYLRDGPLKVLSLGDSAPADLEAIVVGIHNVLLLKHKDTVDRLGRFGFGRGLLLLLGARSIHRDVLAR